MTADPQQGKSADVAATVLVVTSLVWTGALLGVSFLATPVKFLAPSLSLPVALDVGRQTFFWFGRLELALALVCLGAALLAHRRSEGLARLFNTSVVLAALLLAGVLLQRLWLLPLLDARVELIFQGVTPPPSRMHQVYIAVDVARLVLLCVLAGLAYPSPSRQR